MAFYQATQGEAPSALYLNKNNHAAFLNLLLLPLVARFVAGSTDGSRFRAASGGVIVLFLTVVFLIGSRGAFLGFIGGVLFLLWGLGIARWRRHWLLFSALVAIALLLANIGFEPTSSTGARVATLAQPGEAGASRFLIWETSVEMLREHPLWGIGLGTFWMMYPAFRHPDDASGGFFVHNDYLQIWLEAGLPGLLLILLIGWSLFRSVSAFRQRAGGNEVEVYGLTAGLAAVGVHSVFTFNLYILSILILCGLYLGRLHHHCYSTPTNWRLNLQRIRRKAFVPLLIAGLIPPFGYFLSVTLSQYYLERADKVTTENLGTADRLLGQAQGLTPALEAIRSARGELWRSTLGDLEGERAAEAFKQSVAAYLEGHRLNGYVPRPLVGLGRLYSEYPQWADEGNAAEIAEAYFTEAIRLDPRSLSARRNLAFHQLRQGDTEAALAALEGGLKYRYPPTLNLAGYYSFASQLYEEIGKDEQSIHWHTKAEAITEKIERKRTRTAPSASMHG
ncbi:O-antigen ligase family protein [Thiohalomonas denitrificans]|nr:O-antigen ligase family protein [Thiohalomonas denitrificans]